MFSWDLEQRSEEWGLVVHPRATEHSCWGPALEHTQMWAIGVSLAAVHSRTCPREVTGLRSVGLGNGSKLFACCVTVCPRLQPSPLSCPGTRFPEPWSGCPGTLRSLGHTCLGEPAPPRAALPRPSPGASWSQELESTWAWHSDQLFWREHRLMWL